jgi:exodeoxyribonuclease VII large subunit
MSARSPFAPVRSAPREPGEAEDLALTVAQLDRQLQSAVRALGVLVVEGEVSGCKGANASGHVYFTLKDEREDASIACVMFRRDAQLGGGERLINGARVRLRAEASLYAPRGSLQLVASKVQPAGLGDLLARREELKRRLGAEGLFEAERKRPLPRDPRVVGVVTSATGAAFQDIVKVAMRRGSVRIVLAHALVQGEEAPRQLRAALARLASLRGADAVDVIILGRGGGSAEDLAAFDDEALVRTVVACPIPIVAAVGHEVDWSIVCMAADVRAATPSQAAELVVPDYEERRRRLDEGQKRLGLAVRARLHEDHAILARIDARLRAPERAIGQARQQVDDLEQRMLAVVRRAVQRGGKRQDELARRLEAQSPRLVLGRARGEVDRDLARVQTAMARALDRRERTLGELAAKLQAISPLAVLSRGYAIALADGVAVRDAAEVAIGQAIEVRVARGALSARVTATHPPATTSPSEAEPSARTEPT